MKWILIFILVIGCVNSARDVDVVNNGNYTWVTVLDSCGQERATLMETIEIRRGLQSPKEKP